MPLFSIGADGKREKLKRQCTRNYKIVPIRRMVAKLNGGSRRPVRQVIGISYDEWQRMRTSDVRYITNVYPLVDRRMTRADCVAWLGRRGYPIPRKSSCIACPLRNAAEWREIRADPRSWAAAVAFDEGIRRVKSLTRRQEVFVYRDAIPLVQADLRSEQDRGQAEMDFDGCGVLCGDDDA